MNAGKLLIPAICLAALGIPASAEVIIDFSGTGAGSGSISGNNSTVTGTNILIDQVTGNFTPANPGTTNIIGGSLTFSGTGGSHAGGVYTYTGGTFSITGSDPTVGINASTILLSGTITDLTVNLNNPGQIVTSVVANNIDSTLASYFGVTTGPIGGTPVEWMINNGTIHLANITGPNSDGFYRADTFSTDLPDTPVPEPASIFMLGTVLVGVTQVVRRRAKTV